MHQQNRVTESKWPFSHNIADWLPTLQWSELSDIMNCDIVIPAEGQIGLLGSWDAIYWKASHARFCTILAEVLVESI